LFGNKSLFSWTAYNDNAHSSLYLIFTQGLVLIVFLNLNFQ